MSANTADAKQIFLEAVENHEPDCWPDFLQEACGSDTVLRERVEALLAAYRQPNPILDGNSLLATLEQPARIEGPGTVIGPYKLLEQIGEGGFGVVFLAEQERPVRRKVALKIIKPGMDTRQVIARFEAERQALAMMDHPNIAKVFDAGATETGRPYFVMELVQGVPITEYCDECNLTPNERLMLYITVCQAVQHAHQKGVIHRDIKPTNVLIGLQDGQPAPKIIDFGVAKALHDRLTENTLATGFAQMLGTPLYMSPEQAALSPLGVDTRSDIYSLGVLLYELLTGTTPFDKERLHAAPYDELRRIISHEEPPRPSARINTLAGNLATTVAERRRSDVRRLSQQVRGELDWIVMKCLDKDRNRRYETASALSNDVMHYLADEPVSAVAPSRFYRAGKFIRRNKWPVIAGSALLVGLIAGFVGMAIGLISQSQQRAEARLNLAASLHSRGRYAEAEALYRDGLQSASSSAPIDRQRAARTRLRLARVVYDRGDSIESEQLYREAIAAYRAEFPPDDPNVGHALVTFALLLRSHHRFDEAESLFREAYGIYSRSTPANHRATGESATHLANVLITLGRHDEAVPHAREAIAQHLAAVPQNKLALAFARLELGRALLALGRFPEAEVQLLDAEPELTKTDAFHIGLLAPISLYSAWDKAEPGKGYDVKALEWNRRLIGSFVRLDTIPVTVPVPHRPN
jgi:serine/threonine protein kinase